jgi:hypothetical protein
MRLKLISAQPATKYYAWQVEVYLTQFLRLGYNPKDIHIVAGYTYDIDQSWADLYHAYPDVEIQFYKYKETDYAPAMQSAVLAQHFKKFEWLKDCAIFFHDADFVFTKYFDFSPFLNEETWYFSDTISYIGADYIKSKSPSILDIMCATVGIDRSVVEANQQNSGGAQKLMKNVTSDYWMEVNVHSNNLYALLKKVSHIKPEDHQYGIQIWTASMWAELWTAWKRGFIVEVPKEFDFCWATCHISRWDELSFFHNAGVAAPNRGLFYKGDFIDRLPYGVDVDVDMDHCSRRYYELIQSVQTKLVSL